MLGFNEARQTVHDPFASEMREALRRAQAGEMTSQEKQCEKRLNEARNKYSFVWM